MNLPSDVQDEAQIMKLDSYQGFDISAAEGHTFHGIDGAPYTFIFALQVTSQQFHMWFLRSEITAQPR